VLDIYKCRRRLPHGYKINPYMNVSRDVPYGEHARCVLDVYGVRSGAAVPVVLVIHGGAWIRGDKRGTEDVCRLLASRGLVVVSSNYQLATLPGSLLVRAMLGLTAAFTVPLLWTQHVRRSVVAMYVALLCVVWVFIAVNVTSTTVADAEGVLPPHVGDVERVLQWVEERVGWYGGDPQSVVLLGHSAGAHLVSLLALRRSTRQRCPVMGVVGISGVYSHARLKMSWCGSWLSRVAFGIRESYSSLFPVACVHDHTPPHLLINAEWDLGLMRHTWDMAVTMRAHGVYIRCRRYAGTHLSIMKEWGRSGANACILRDVLAFIDHVSAREDTGQSSCHVATGGVQADSCCLVDGP